MVSFFVLTFVHSDDLAIVNNIGRLRYLTQNIGMALLTKRFNMSGEIDDFYAIPELDSFIAVYTITGSLLGSRLEAVDATIPEILDESVKDALKEWNERVHQLEAQRANLNSLAEGEIIALVAEVNGMTRDLDFIVNLAEESAEERVLAISSLSIARGGVGVMWASVVSWSIFKIWRPWVTTYIRLQMVEQQQGSLLRATSDILILISMVEPFEVLESDASLDRIVGRPMLGESVLGLSKGAKEQEDLEGLLASIGHEDALLEPLHSGFSWHVGQALARVLPRVDIESLPVAHKIRSCWRVGCPPSGDLLSQQLDVELMLAGRACSASDKGEVLLAVRFIGIPSETGQSPCQPDPTPTTLALGAATASGGSSSVIGSGSSGSGQSRGHFALPEDWEEKLQEAELQSLPSPFQVASKALEDRQFVAEDFSLDPWSAILDDFQDDAVWDAALQVSRIASLDRRQRSGSDDALSDETASDETSSDLGEVPSLKQWKCLDVDCAAGKVRL